MPIPFKPLPPAELLREYYIYDPETGVLVLRNSSLGHPAGKPLGSLSKDGYLVTRLRRERFALSRLVWKWMTGEDPEGLQIDHINGDPADNRWANLRCVEGFQNVHNKHRPTPSLSGIPGAQWLPKESVWVVSAYYRRERHYFGVFSDPDLVIQVLRDFHLKTRGEFFNEGKWLSHIEKSRPWIEWCRELAGYEIVRRNKLKEVRKATGPRKPTPAEKKASSERRWAKREAERHSTRLKLDEAFAEVMAERQITLIPHRPLLPKQCI